MTELEIRNKFVATAKSYLGYKESDGSHRKIIDIYNSHKPLARGYAVRYTDAWCATFVSAMAILCGLTDIIPTECGCGQQIELFQKLGRWVENDAYVPAQGDIIYYYWKDNGVGDCTGRPDHVGIVVSVNPNSKEIKIIEGNKSDSVSYRDIKVNATKIRGYAVPNFASKATKEVKTVKWYEKSGEWALATESGIVDGTRPDDNASRAEVATMIWRVFGNRETVSDVENPFTDVSKMAWYYDAVMWMYKNGITSGTSANEFSPTNVCTRAEVAAFILRAKKLEAK